MNLACSYIQPIEGRLLDVLAEIGASHKIRMNIGMGKEMVNELRFWSIDPLEVGDISEDEEGGDDGNDEATLAKLLEGGIDDDEEDKTDSSEARAMERRAIYD